MVSGMTYAWYVNSSEYEGNLVGSSKVNYFAKGTGT
jgi:hypothetical protein